MLKTIGFIGENGSIDGSTFNNLEEGIDLLIDYMKRELIHPSFWRTIQKVRNGKHRYEGNFQRVSLLFGIETVDKGIIEKLDAALASHFQSEQFIAAVGEYIRNELAGAEDSRRRLGRVGEGLAKAAEVEVAELRRGLLRRTYALTTHLHLQPSGNRERFYEAIYGQRRL